MLVFGKKPPARFPPIVVILAFAGMTVEA